MILGDYDRRIQNADFSIFGQYNIKRASKIKIFFIPLSFVIKILFRNEKAIDLYREQLCKLPEIKRDSDKDVRYFRISVKGNLNKNNFQLEMKNIL